MRLTEKQRKRLKKNLSERRTELERQISEQKNELSVSAKEAGFELSVNDNHPGDIGTELFTSSRDRLLLARKEQQLDDMQLALDRLDNGTYGECAICGKAIPYARLEAIPWTTCCIRHADATPAVPTALGAAPHRREFGIGFDGKDAWGIVAGWGNASETVITDEFTDESDMADDDGYVEPLESFLATDLYGTARLVVRNDEYRKYIEQGEGDLTLESDNDDDESV